MLRVFLARARGWRGRASFARVICSGEALPPELRDALLERLAARRSCTTSTARPRRRWTSTVWRVRAGADARAACRSAGRSPTPQLYDPRRASAAGARSACRASCYIGGVQRGARLPRPARADGRALRARPVRRAAGARMYRTGDLGRWRPTARSSTSAASTSRSRCAASASSSARSRPPGRRTRASRAGGGDRARGPARATCAWSPTSSPAPGARIEPSGPAASPRTCAAGLPEYMVPQHFVRAGRASRCCPTARSTARRCRAGRDAQAGASERRRAAQRARAKRRSAHGGGARTCPALGVHDDFFALGGHSLLAAQLTARLNREFELEAAAAHAVRGADRRAAGGDAAPPAGRAARRRTASCDRAAPRRPAHARR